MKSPGRTFFVTCSRTLLLLLASIPEGPGFMAATTGTWTPASSMTTDRDGHTMTTLSSGLILVTGGSGSAGWMASAEIYNPGSGSWFTVNSMSTSRRDHTATLLADGRVLVAGGYNTPAPAGLKSAEIYNPVTGLWSPAENMTTGRFNHTATLLGNGTVLVAGGLGNLALGSLASAEIYDPSTNAWSPAGVMATDRYWHRATLLPDGRVLVTGGGSTASASGLTGAELYEPGTNSWSAAADMTVDRSLHTATLLADGRVLVTGGNSAAGTPLAETELYDPATDTWSSAGDMNAPRAAHAAVRLGDGRVVVVAGGNDCFYVASSELYDPASSTWSWTGSLGVDRVFPLAALLAGGKVLLAGGFTSTSGMTAAVDLYDVNVAPPRPPTAVVAAAGDETAAASWTPPPADADPVLEYVVTECPDGYIFKVPGSETDAALTGLYNDQTITLTVVTRKAYGSSPPSLPSNAVTPKAGSPAPDSASATVSSAGGTVTTDTGGTGPTATDAVETSVGVPATAGGGSVTIAETAITVPAPTGFQLLGQQVEITSDAATTAANPLVIVFTLDESIVSGQTPASIQIFRTENGGPATLVPNCTGAPGTASPDPCVSSRAYVNVTDIQITVLTSSASLWNMAVAAEGCPATCDDGNPCTQDTCDPPTGRCRFDPLPGLSCNDGNACTTGDVCVPAGGGATCQGSPLNCDDGIGCTIDSCDPAAGCLHAPVPAGEVGAIQFASASAIQWSPTPDATHWNTYRGSIPIGLLGSRPPGPVYDQTCFESADSGGNGATTAVDPATPALGAAFYYLVDGEGACGESVLGRDSSGTVIANTSPCPTPP